MTTLYVTIAMMGSSAALEGLDVKKKGVRSVLTVVGRLEQEEVRFSSGHRW